MRNIIHLFVLVIAVVGLQAQNGSISGLVFDQESKETLIGVNVILEGTTIGAASDYNGNYSIVNVAPGTYNVVSSYLSYENFKIEGVVVRAGETTQLEIPMKEAGGQLDEVIVKARADRQNENVQLAERKKASLLVQNVGAKELSKKGASNAADGLKTIVGMSVVGGNQVFVRGMGDRYNIASLNTLPIASLDPDKKVIPLDIFPTDIIESMSVIKAFSPELYGDFAGGMIDIRTKRFPESKFLKIGVGSTFITNTTFKDFDTYAGTVNLINVGNGTSSQNWDLAQSLFDNNTQLPNDIDPFTANLNPTRTSASPAGSFNIAYGDLHEWGSGKNKKSLGVLLSASTNNGYQTKEGTYKLINNQNDVKLDYDYIKYQQSSSLSGLANLHLDLGKSAKINYNFLYTRLLSNESRDTWGTHFDYSSSIFTRRYTSKRNELMSHQLLGQHRLTERFEIKWAGSFNQANSHEPDRRQLVYLYDAEDETNSYVFNAIDRLDNHRFFSELQENEWAGDISTKYVAAGNTKNPKVLLALGLQAKNKQRNFDFRQFIYDLSAFSSSFPGGVDPMRPDNYLNAANIQDGVIEIEEVNNAASFHTSTLSILAAYLRADLKLASKLTATLGLRAEDGKQKISYRDQQQPLFERENELSGLELLPSLAVKWEIAEKDQLWLNMSKTISRPGFKEVAPFEFIEVFAGVKTIGNPDLINGTNYNVDLRFERFPSPGQLISLGLFAKYLDSPIEQTMLATASGRLQSYTNAESAIVIGAEVEWKKKLTAIVPDFSLFKNLSVGFNASYIHSNVKVGETDSGTNIQTNTERALQGASPYLVNADLSWSKIRDNSRSNITLSYNVFGDRIFAAGIQGLGDVYETSASTLNLIAQHEFNSRWGVKLSARNLLNPKFKYVQNTDTEDVELETSTRGISIGFGISYKLK